jgi:hypothetical protein
MSFKKAFKLMAKFREEFLLVKGAACKSVPRQFISYPAADQNSVYAGRILFQQVL